jgi:hypothetical protein
MYSVPGNLVAILGQLPKQHRNRCGIILLRNIASSHKLNFESSINQSLLRKAPDYIFGRASFAALRLPHPNHTFRGLWFQVYSRLRPAKTLR